MSLALKTFDVDFPPSRMTSSVEQNLKKIVKKYGERFLLQSTHAVLPTRLYLDNSHGVKHYIMRYDLPNRTSNFFPFKVDFIDVHSGKVAGKNAYISSIHRTGDISGTHIMELILRVLTILNVHRVSLRDVATISCNKREIDLSLFKLIEKGTTFYGKFGFHFDVTLMRSRYPSKEYMNKVLMSSLAYVKRLRVSEVRKVYHDAMMILLQAISDQNYSWLKFETHAPFDYVNKDAKIVVPLSSNRSTCFQVLREIDTVLKVLDGKFVLLCELLVHMFRNHCDTYVTLYDNVINYNIESISYGPDEKVVFPFRVHLNHILAIRSNSTFVLDLKKDSLKHVSATAKPNAELPFISKKKDIFADTPRDLENVGTTTKKIPKLKRKRS